MSTRTMAVFAAVAGIAIGVFVGCGRAPQERQATPAPGPASAGQKGGQDQTGPYTVAENWPKPLSQLPGHEQWTWGAVQGIFAESPNRVFILMRGELPTLKRPAEIPYPSVGPSLSFPVSATPFRNASVGPVSSPGNSGSDGWNGWKGKMGVDARWEHCLFVVDAEGNIVESWMQWDSIFRRPHSVFINPYDPIDQFRTGGPSTPQVLYASPDKHLWIADNATSKIVKYDMDGRYQYSWGSQGEWPGAMWNVHGMSVDQEGNLYLAEVNNGRAQKFVPRPDADKAHLVGPPLRAVQ